jgi:hypothetical protein
MDEQTVREQRAKSRYAMTMMLSGRIAEDSAPQPADCAMRVAWHEAAHAVIALAIGQTVPLTLRSVSVIPCAADGTLGRALFGKPSADPKEQSKPLPIADDRHRAILVAFLVARTWKDVRREMRWCRDYARQLVRHAYPFEIAAVARALLEDGEMQAPDVVQLVGQVRAERRRHPA